MKKITALLLMLALAIGILAGCNDPVPPAGEEPEIPGAESPTIPEGLTGADVAKILLAGERLDGEMIDGSGLFANGAEVFSNLAAEARRSSAVFLDAGGSVGKVQLLSGVEIYDEFDLFSRNYAEFESTAGCIIEGAEYAASNIDYVKEHIRILDVWVSADYNENIRYFLHVEENSEIIIVENFEADRYQICRRYTNENGDDVYETYDSMNGGMLTEYATYIQGKKYDFYMNDANRSDEHCQGISANNDKGYWEILDFAYDPAWVESRFSSELITIKDDFCYSVFYDLRSGELNNYVITSADRGCDIAGISKYSWSDDLYSRFSLQINLAAFSGYDYLTSGEGNVGEMYMKNGKIVRIGDFIVGDGDSYEAEITSVISTTSAFGREGYLMFNLAAKGSESNVRAAIITFLTDLGLTCKYDMNAVFLAYDRAKLEANNAIKYFYWNGYHIGNSEGATAAVEVARGKFAALRAEYEKVKDERTVKAGSTAAELLIKFAKVSPSVGSAVYDNGKVTVTGVSLTIDDTILMVEGATYHVALALKSTGGNLLALAISESGTAYGEGDSFTVTADSITLDVPMLEEEYLLVAYIASDEGIRSSTAEALKFSSVVGEPIKSGNTVLTAEKTASGELCLKYTKDYDAEISLAAEAPMSYAEFYELVADNAYSYGEPSTSLIEIVGEGGTVTSMSGDEAVVESGYYRIAYSIENGEQSVSGYVYVTFTAGVN